MMCYILRLYKIIFTVCISSIFLLQPAWAQLQVQNTSVYTDETTGTTIFITDVKIKGRNFFPAQSGIASPFTQLGVLDIQPAGLSQEQMDDHELYSELLFEKADETEFIFRVGGILRHQNASKGTIAFHPYDDQAPVQTVEIDLRAAQENFKSAQDFDAWLKSRFYEWQYIAGADAPNTMLDIWSFNLPYGEKVSRIPSYNQERWRGDEPDQEMNLGSLEMFGGQIAIRETLQTQLLNTPSTNDLQQQTGNLIAIKSISGVEVMAHPYKEMLTQLKAKSQAAPEISELANYVPVDRLMIMVREPKAIAHFLDENNDLPNRLTPIMGSSFVDNEILQRYTNRFGLTPEKIRQWFSGENVAEIVLFAPDIFFLDNTDITAIIRLKDNPNLAFKAAQSIPSGTVLPVKLPRGDTFYITNHNNFLIFSSNESELQKTLEIANKQGEGSLGKSDEFQVMNYKLPMNAQSHVYVYFSDPFVRRLTGPEVKIGQLRRSVARSQIQIITAAALLYRIDQGVDAPDIETLKKRNYLSELIAPEGEYTLEKNARVVSKTWGTLDRLTTLTANPVIEATAQEIEQYEMYRENYSRYWSKFFDPIAVRADLMANGNMALETFILPLIDNSFYMELQHMLGKQPPQKTIVPLYDKPAISTLTINIPRLPEEITEELFDNTSVFRYSSLSKLIPLIGSTAVISIQDAEPIVQTAFPGLTSLSGNRRNALGFGGEEMLIVPVVSAIFSRPIDVAFPISDENLAKKIVRNFYYPSDNEFFSLNKAYSSAEEKLYLDMNIAGMIRMEFAVSVENGWLHITNHPWTAPTIKGTQELAPNHASIIVKPSDIQKGMPQIISLAQKSYRQSAYASASELYPWMLAYDVDAQTALSMQKNALGRGTPLPPDATFDLSSPLRIKPYGASYGQEINTFSIKNHANFDYLQQDLIIWFRFEEDGLRSHIEFSTNK